MSALACCGSAAGGARQEKVRRADGAPHPRSLVRRGAKGIGWVVPSAILLLMPKCPACVVAYVLIATGAGISMGTAAQMRLVVLAACAVSLVGLTVRVVLRGVRVSSRRWL